MNWFTAAPFQNIRLHTHNVKIGSLQLGSGFPVRVQSMANTPTHNVDASVRQAIEIIKAGGEMVRFTVINSKDAEALREIKSRLVSEGYHTPIVADVHFNPQLADIAATSVDKVRINPGNYLDKRATFATVSFTEIEYQQELNRIEERFSKFLKICSEHKTAVRIGTNHGSLSDRIMNRYGDTPEGMVEATMEFLRICNKHQFTNVVVSLKSSNTRVMVFAYRLLALQMQTEGLSYALHLGVTEAGNGEDGRIKSAVGLGALMHDGLGDTIRVSLTEHPAKEIPVALTLVNHFNQFREISVDTPYSTDVCFNPYEYHKSTLASPFDKPLVIADLASEKDITPALLSQLGFSKSNGNQQFSAGDLSPDVLFIGEHVLYESFSNKTIVVVDSNYWEGKPGTYPLFSIDEYLLSNNKSPVQNWLQITLPQITPQFLNTIKSDNTLVLVCFSYHKNYIQELRILINLFKTNGINNPIVLQQGYNVYSDEEFQLKSAADTGLFFIDGLCDGLWLKNNLNKDRIRTVETTFGILQASRIRTTKTEYISCPGCGRTLFDLEKSIEEVKAATTHLKGLKIAVMGCIVNGPGEMADADYGYVGAGLGRVSLYKGKELVMRNIPVDEALKNLIALIDQDTSG